MTEIELLQLQDLYVNRTIAVFVNYVTFFSGYLIANYYLAKKLSSLQFSIMNIGYLILCTSSMAVEYRAALLTIGVQEKLLQMDTFLEVLPISRALLIVTIGVMLLMLSGSFIFSFSFRKSDDSDT